MVDLGVQSNKDYREDEWDQLLAVSSDIKCGKPDEANRRLANKRRLFFTKYIKTAEFLAAVYC